MIEVLDPKFGLPEGKYAIVAEDTKGQICFLSPVNRSCEKEFPVVSKFILVFCDFIGTIRWQRKDI